MCRLKSAIILKDRIFMPDYDSHSDMLSELGIKDDYLAASKKFVRVELSPVDNDAFSDIDSWVLKVDQDIKPEWFDEDTYLPIMREKVKEWAKDHIHIGVDRLILTTGENHYIKDCKDINIGGNASINDVCGNTIINDVCDDATINSVYGDVIIKNVYDNALIRWVLGNVAVHRVCSNATIKHVGGKATVDYVCGNAVLQKVYDNATISSIWGNATICRIENNATIKRAYDNAKIQIMHGSGLINDVWGNVTVNYVQDDAVINSVWGNAVIKSVHDRVIINDVGGNTTINHVYDNATIKSSACSRWNNSDKIILCDNATFKDCYTKTLYQSGGWKLVDVNERNKQEDDKL